MPRLTLLVGDPWIDLSALNGPLARAVTGVGALYPSTGLGPGKAHNNLAWQLDRDTRFTQKLGDWTALAAEVADAKPAEILLNLPLTTPEPAAAISEMRRRLPNVISDIRILLYLRPHADRIMAAQNRLLTLGEGPFDTRAFLDRALSSSACSAAPHIAA